MLGEGAWGTAVATVLAHNGIKVKLWCQDPSVANCIKTQHRNERYFPYFALNSLIEPVTDIKQALSGVTYVFVSTPVKYFRSVLEQAGDSIYEDQIWICLNKGIENETLLFPSQIINDVCDCAVRTAVLAGPSFAYDLAAKRVTAVTIAADDCDLASQIQGLMANEYFRPYTTDDIVGVQLGAALKNVMALAVGIADGAGMTDNTTAFLLTRGISEIAQLVKRRGGRIQTVYGLSGIGDTIMTAMSKLSRNRQVGLLLGQGKSLATIQQERPVLPEGINTVRSMYQMMERHGLELPICHGVYNIVFHGSTIHELVASLMARSLEPEC